MWIAKIFGKWGRVNDDEQSEPAQFPPHPAASTRRPVAPREPQAAQPKPAKSKANNGKGFDPYDSGSFKQQDWKRIHR